MKRNYLRATAITLIALPEPFTTPIGVALLIASYLLPKRHKDNLRNLELIIKRYKSYTGRSRFDSVDNKNELVVFHQLNRDLLYLRENIVNDAVATKNSNFRASLGVQTRYMTTRSRYNHLNDNRRVSNNVIHHVLRTSLPLFEVEPMKSDKVVHHVLRTASHPLLNTVCYSSLRPIRPIDRSERIIHHSLNRF
jgi:hypothetical protein